MTGATRVRVVGCVVVDSAGVSAADGIAVVCSIGGCVAAPEGVGVYKKRKKNNFFVLNA